MMAEKEGMDESWEDDDKEPTSGNDEHRDRRRRAKQGFLTANIDEAEKIDSLEDDKGFHHVQFKISPAAARRGEKVAGVFNLSLSQYCKALLYANLGLFDVPLDRRRKTRKQKGVR